MANNCYDLGNEDRNAPKGRSITEFDAKYCPPFGNPAYAFTCDVPCVDSRECSDIQEGEFEFAGPATVFGVENLVKSYLIVKVLADGTEKPWSAVWPTGRVLINTNGDYKIKYKWDACHATGEPKFDFEAGCPCPLSDDSGAPI